MECVCVCVFGTSQHYLLFKRRRYLYSCNWGNRWSSGRRSVSKQAKRAKSGKGVTEITLLEKIISILFAPLVWSRFLAGMCFGLIFFRPSGAQAVVSRPSWMQTDSCRLSILPRRVCLIELSHCRLSAGVVFCSILHFSNYWLRCMCGWVLDFDGLFFSSVTATREALKAPRNVECMCEKVCRNRVVQLCLHIGFF